MTLLFGSLPSWHSMPCAHSFPATLICKSRVKATHTAIHHLNTGYQYTKCNSGEIFVIDHCFGLRLSVELETNLVSAFRPKRSVENYFIHLFSLLAWQSSQVYHIVMANDPRTGKPNKCASTYMVNQSPFIYDRNAIISRSTCENINGSKTVHIVSMKSGLLVHCGVNQFQCDDGTCISHEHICDWPNDCSMASCVCWVEGREITDVRYCRDVCMPGKCFCPEHYFQCTAGGCIQISFLCDGAINCQDGSDEFCKKQDIRPRFAKENPATEILLKQKLFCLGFVCPGGKCIPIRYINDLLPDCPSRIANDEYLFLQLRFQNKRLGCRDPQEIPCVAGLPVCFPMLNFCLYDFDEYGILRWCRNGAHLGDCTAINCTNSYKCPESYCIPFHRVCDGYSDCIHGEDEGICDDYICKGLLRCSGSRVCVHPSDVCDRIPQCPNADDEKLCDIGVCPSGCRCVSHSIVCTINSTNTFPEVTGEYVKRLSIVHSFMPFPNVHNICKQNKLLVLNLTRNEVIRICGTLQHNCKFHSSLIMLDLAWNKIISLQPFCFDRLRVLRSISLAHNPLLRIDGFVFDRSLISYLDMRGTKLETLPLGSIQRMKNLELLNIMDLELYAVEGYANTLSSNHIEILFNDKRFCCIFTLSRYCTGIGNLKSVCRTLLYHRLLGYTIATIGILSMISNSIAVTVNIKVSKGRKLSKFVSFLCLTDAALASYLPYLGIADIYYDYNFVFAIEQWEHSLMCNFMDVLTASGTMTSLWLSGFLIFLTGQGVTKIKFDIEEIWHKLLFGQIVALIMIVAINVSVTMVRLKTNDPLAACNMMANSQLSSWSDKAYSFMLIMLMMVVLFVITFSTVKVNNHIVQSRKDIAAISGMNSAMVDTGKGVCKFMIAILLVKLTIIMPYPLLQFASLLHMNISGYANQYATVAFIISESFYNPIVFVFRPLMAKGDRKIVRTKKWRRLLLTRLCSSDTRIFTLQWRHNGRDGVSNHQPHDCLLNRLFRRRSKKTSKLRVTGLCAGHSPGTGEFLAQMASNVENVSIWWRHHEYSAVPLTSAWRTKADMIWNKIIWSVR